MTDETTAIPVTEPVAEAPTDLFTKAQRQYQRNRPFLVIDSVFRPARGVRTERSGWADAGENWSISEQPRVVDSLKESTLRTATVIIDVLRNRVVKCRFPDADTEAVKSHYTKKYSEQIAQAIPVWAGREAQRRATLTA